MLARAGLGDHPPLAHPLGEERLAEDVVDLVGAGVTEVLALQVDPGAAGLLAEARREVERGGPPGVVPEEPGEARLERGVAPRPGVRALELDERGHERLGHEAAAEPAEVPLRVGQGGGPRPRALHR